LTLIIKMCRSRYFFILLFSILSLPAQGGQTVVLIHGYLSDGSQWRPLGIVNALQQVGWVDAGHTFPSGPAMLPPLNHPNAPDHYVYTVTLPSEAFLSAQANWLGTYLQAIQARHPDNDLILVGHSVGGVVARLAVVSMGIPIKGLITIASPHLGTDSAETGIMINNSPLGWFAPFVGLGTLNRSQGLYWDLVREYPGSLLFWLNRQPHPMARYISVVRSGEEIGAGDCLVPAYSQDMNNVPALRGRSEIIFSVGTHALQPADGHLLATILATMQPDIQLPTIEK
jgi:pimeloyl-ACP methyl ester carboxylesterase